MAKRWKGHAAAALTVSLTAGMIGTSYGATLTLAGFGADQTVEETEAQPKKKAAEKKEQAAAQTEAAQTEAA